ncbi:MAG: glycosyltransferase family 2 protein [bacterium]
MQKPRITIILPAYNGARWIETAIKSAQNQTFTDFELLVFNDCSKDNTEEIVLRLAEQDNRIIYTKNEKNLGVQRTRNIALQKAQGEYIAEIDQDDEWIDKDKLQKQLSFLENNKDYVLVGTGAIMIDEKGNEIARYLMLETDNQIKNKLLRANCFIHSSVMYRKDIVIEIGGYTIEKMSEDHDLWLRLGRHGKFMNFPTYSVKYLFTPSGYNSQDKILRLKQNLLFTKEHKDFYPNYVYSVIYGWAKILFTPIFNLLPTRLKGFFLWLHKKI